MKKLVVLLIFLALLAVVYFFTPLPHYLSQEGLESLQAWIQAQGVWAPLVFSLIYILATIFALPGSVLTISGGVLFGTVLGTPLSLFSATVGACFAFLISRYIGKGFFEKFTSQKIQAFDEKLGKHGFYTVLYLRLIPLFPFNVLNFSLGITKVKFKDYFLATLLGMAPGAFVYTSLGGASHYVDFKDPHVWLDYRVWGPFVLVVVLSLVPKVYRKWIR